MSESPTCWMFLLAVENLAPRGTKVKESSEGMWLVKLFLKKFQLSCPPTENMATMFPESRPSLRNLRAIPGMVFWWWGSGSAARDILMMRF